MTTKNADTTRKMLPRTEADEPAVSGAPMQKAKPSPYRLGEGSRISARRGKQARETGVSKSLRKKAGSKSSGY